MKNILKQIIYNAAIVGLYLASFSAILILGMFALDGGVDDNISADYSEEKVTHKILTNYEVEINGSDFVLSNEGNNDYINL